MPKKLICGASLLAAIITGSAVGLANPAAAGTSGDYTNYAYDVTQPIGTVDTYQSSYYVEHNMQYVQFTSHYATVASGGMYPKVSPYDSLTVHYWKPTSTYLQAGYKDTISLATITGQPIGLICHVAGTSVVKADYRLTDDIWGGTDLFIGYFPSSVAGKDAGVVSSLRDC